MSENNKLVLLESLNVLISIERKTIKTSDNHQLRIFSKVRIELLESIKKYVLRNDYRLGLRVLDRLEFTED